MLLVYGREKNFRTIVKCFVFEKRNYNTYRIKSTKDKTVVIKGIEKFKL